DAVFGRKQHGGELCFITDFCNENAQEDREEQLVHAGKAITPGASIIGPGETCMKRCHNCGNSNEEAAKYCMSCGRSMTQADPESGTGSAHGTIAHYMVSTTFDLPGLQIQRNLGLVRGIVVRSRSIIGTVGASLQTLVGGDISLFTELCENTR